MKMKDRIDFLVTLIVAGLFAAPFLASVAGFVWGMLQ